jgi:hypothetical protein
MSDLDSMSDDDSDLDYAIRSAISGPMRIDNQVSKERKKDRPAKKE